MPSDKQFALALFVTLATACSSAPAPKTLAAAGNLVADTPGAAATAATTTIAAADTAAADTAAASPSVVDAGLVKAGYSVMRRYGEIFYCRNEVITGQRIGTRICLTAAQIQVEKQNVTKARDLLNQPANRCLGAACTN